MHFEFVDSIIENVQRRFYDFVGSTLGSNNVTDSYFLIKNTLSKRDP
jgi:hypothetical protein